MSDQNIYLDHAAATPVDGKVLGAMQPYFSELFYNPSAEYSAARKVRAAIDEARAKVGHWLGVKSTEIIFTAGGTEANNLAITGLMRKYPDANMIVSSIEHESVIEPAKDFEHKVVPVLTSGRIDVAELEKLIDDRTLLISVMYANNEIGTIQPIREISQLLDNVRADRKKQGITNPIYLHTDACQAANYLDLHAERLGVDLMTLNGGKIYGPKQSGALYVSSRLQLEPIIKGGGQERNARSGTEQVASIVGFAESLDIAQGMRHAEVKRLQEIQREFIKGLEDIKDLEVNGSTKNRLPNNVHVTLPGHDNERLIFALDDRGIQAAAGSACSASNDEPSHVLRAIGRTDEDAQASLRFSMGRSTTLVDVQKVVDTLKTLI